MWLHNKIEKVQCKDHETRKEDAIKRDKNKKNGKET